MKQQILVGDCLESLRGLPEQCVHTCVTSPPYFGLRDYDCEGQIGLEATPEAFVARLVEVFREVRRVLRDDGTLWLNLGDSYGATRSYQVNSTKGGSKHGPAQAAGGKGSVIPNGLKQKDLIGIPWRVAFALQADGWYLRQEIIWAKPNPMPESIKDRCVKSHEQIFLLSKSPRYFFDHFAIQEDAIGNPSDNTLRKSRPTQQSVQRGNQCGSVPWEGGGKRNRRSVWTVSTKPFKEAHFATFPPDLIEPCVLAGAPERCCSQCGAPHLRETSRGVDARSVDASELDRFGTGEAGVHRKIGSAYQKWMDENPLQTMGWTETCDCNAAASSGVVLDPFFGAGTTGLVAQNHGRGWIGCELNPDYVKIIRRRLGVVESSASDDALLIWLTSP